MFKWLFGVTFIWYAEVREMQCGDTVLFKLFDADDL